MSTTRTIVMLIPTLITAIAFSLSISLIGGWLKDRRQFPDTLKPAEGRTYPQYGGKHCDMTRPFQQTYYRDPTKPLGERTSALAFERYTDAIFPWVNEDGEVRI